MGLNRQQGLGRPVIKHSDAAAVGTLLDSPPVAGGKIVDFQWLCQLLPPNELKKNFWFVELFISLPLISEWISDFRFVFTFEALLQKIGTN